MRHYTLSTRSKFLITRERAKPRFRAKIGDFRAKPRREPTGRVAGLTHEETAFVFLCGRCQSCGVRSPSCSVSVASCAVLMVACGEFHTAAVTEENSSVAAFLFFSSSVLFPHLDVRSLAALLCLSALCAVTASTGVSRHQVVCRRRQESRVIRSSVV